MREIVLINITGEDRPGLTAAITGVLAQGGVNILDIGQAVIHDTLSFGILVEIPSNEQSSSVLKDILFTAYKLDQQVRFTPVSEDDYQQWVDGQGKQRHIVTLLTRKVTAEQLQRVSSITAKYGLNIDHIDRLSGRMPWICRPIRARAASSSRCVAKPPTRKRCGPSSSAWPRS